MRSRWRCSRTGRRGGHGTGERWARAFFERHLAGLRAGGIVDAPPFDARDCGSCAAGMRPRWRPSPSQPRVRTLGAVGLGVLCVSQFVDVLSVNTAVIALPDIRRDLGIGAIGSAVGDQHLRAAVREPAAAGRAPGRPRRPSAAVHDRSGRLRGGLAAVRRRAVGGGAGRGARGDRRRGRAHRPRGAGAAGGRHRRGARGRGRWAGGRRPAPAVASPAWRSAACSPPLAGWRAAFIVPAALALACLPLVAALGPGPAADDRRPLDLGGALAAVAGLVLLLAGLSAIGQGGAAFRRGRCWRGPRSRCSPSCASRPARSPTAPPRLVLRSAAGGGHAGLGRQHRGDQPARGARCGLPPGRARVVAGRQRAELRALQRHGHRGVDAGATLLRRVGAARTFALALVRARGDAAGLVRDQRRLRGGRAHGARGRSTGSGWASPPSSRPRSGRPARPRTVAAWRRADQHRRAARYAMSIALLVPLASAPATRWPGCGSRSRYSAAIAAAGVATLACSASGSDLEPLRLEPRADVDVDLAQRPVARVDEPVPLPGGDDDDLAGADLALLVAEEEGRRALLGDEDLVVGVLVQRRAASRRALDDDRADADAAVILSDELAGDVAERQLVHPDDLDLARAHGRAV